MRKIWLLEKKQLILHPLLTTKGFKWLQSQGEMAEWSIASVLKTDVPRGTGGSNPSLSAETTVKVLILNDLGLFYTLKIVSNRIFVTFVAKPAFSILYFV